ncbi:MAG: proteasome activator [Acidimicrobiia bacterium]
MPDEQEVAQAVRPEVVTADDKTASTNEHQTPSVTEPSKLIRIASMTRAMLDEVREAPLDEAGRERLLSIYERSLDELKDVLSADLRDELDSVFIPMGETAPSEAELRIAQAQLVGWLEGLFHGIQASLISQQMAASAQLDRMRRRPAIEANPGQDQGGGLYL